jgi:hypothetical protein
VQNLDAGAVLHCVFAEMTAEGAGAWPAVEKAQHMPRHAAQAHAFPQLAFHIRAPIHQRRVQAAGTVAEETGVDFREQSGILIRGAAQHHAVDMSQMRRSLIQILDAAIEDDL